MKSLNLREKLANKFGKHPSEKKTTPPKHNMPPQHGGQPSERDPYNRDPFNKSRKDPEQW